MAKSSFYIVAMVAVIVANAASAAREMPADDKGLSDQKNFMGFSGVGTYFGVGNNGMPYGGVGGGAATNGVPGFPGGLGAGGVVGVTPNGNIGGVIGTIPGGVIGFGGNPGYVGGSGTTPYP